jgi:Tfp pilus assembly protein PilF
MARRDYKQADYTLAKVLKLQSGNVNAIMLSGWSALQQNDLRKATDQFEEAIERKPGSAQLHVYLAMVLDRREKKSAAVEELRKAIKIDPYNPEAQYNLSVLLATRKKTVKEARTCYERAIRLGHQPSTELEQILYR